jgi:hypothetical protein
MTANGSSELKFLDSTVETNVVRASSGGGSRSYARLTYVAIITENHLVRIPPLPLRRL